jgi:lipooligosaccharide transport system permease protein
VRTLAPRAFAYWMTNYRRTWRGTAVSGGLEPVFFLAAMGVGLGSLVNSGGGQAGLGGVSYLTFLAPGLLAANAMQTGVFESTYPVMGAMKWDRTYQAQTATQLRPVDILLGHLAFVAFRVTSMAAIFLLVMAIFGVLRSPATLLAVLVGTLVGLAYATPVFAFAATRENDNGFAMLFRFGIVPMFLFSGTFFPVSQLPDALEPIAWATPLWHAVDLSRGLALGTAHAGSAAIHVGYLIVWIVGGFVLARRVFDRKLAV